MCDMPSDAAVLLPWLVPAVIYPPDNEWAHFMLTGVALSHPVVAPYLLSPCCPLWNQHLRDRTGHSLKQSGDLATSP